MISGQEDDFLRLTAFNGGFAETAPLRDHTGTIISVYADSAETFLTVGQIILHRECLNI